MTSPYLSSSSSTPRSTCPCQRVPLSLSSATSAEYGDVYSLARRIKSTAAAKATSNPRSRYSSNTGTTNGNGNSPIPGGISNGGITPLHLAAQHGHPAAVSMLLKEGGCDIDTGLPTIDGSRSAKGRISGATPIHRAAFSGAISAMQILLSWGENGDGKKANLLAQDSSFGDKKTPLHKAVAGGRPLAVQLLINALQKRHLLRDALEMMDASASTPLILARQFTSLSPDEIEQERQSVRRWDVVGGGTSADWDICLRLLEGATASLTNSAYSEDALLTAEGTTQQSKTGAKELAELENVAKLYCYDGEECVDGSCGTAVWENSFRGALASHMEMSLNSNVCVVIPKNKTKEKGNGVDIPSQPIETTPQPAVDSALIKAPVPTHTQKAKPMGRQCDSCGKHSTALFRFTNHQLVCRRCRRAGGRMN